MLFIRPGFSRCQGLWMFLDWSSFTRIHMLLQRLRNLLTLGQWARRHVTSAHLWHGRHFKAHRVMLNIYKSNQNLLKFIFFVHASGVGIPCVVCRDIFGSADTRRGCWIREHRTLTQHIWLGQLVQWWAIMGLLPKDPGTDTITEHYTAMKNSF